MSIKITIPNSSSDVLTFGSGNTPTAAQIAGIDSGSSNGQLALYTTASGTSTERVRVDASGNVGIGTSSPISKLHVNSSGSTATYAIVGNSNGGSVFGVDASGLTYVAGYASKTTLFGSYNSGGAFQESARIDSSGNLLVGTTSSIGGKMQVVFDGTGGDGLGLKTSNATLGAGFIRFLNSAGSTAGLIYQSNTTAVTYQATSDERLKTDKGIATSTDVIDNAIVHDFEWKSNNTLERGLFAQEAYLNKPYSVYVGNDELTEDGSLKHPWGIDYSKYVPDLIVHAQQLKKQVQEQQAIITSLTDRITALENK